MKRFLCMLLALCILFSLSACGKKKKEEKKEDTGVKLTLMIYMLGSDLEAKAGAGTNDLEEMAKSGVDPEKVNVLVYTGGAKKWHNDTVSSAETHSLLHLAKDGFQEVSTTPVSSMGEPGNLTSFLNYACDNYPAQEFALILWDHGNGPLIGYGKDMLHGNDSLTLSEMKTAMDASKFGPDNKLAWVGFDACLMSSAELVCTWSDYAKYLVASQEIEPAFGWDYSFLKQLGNQDTTTVLKSLTSEYLASCEAYYEEKGYKDRDTTLACLDLSVAGELKNAIEGLFAKANGDIKQKYNQLSQRRTDTRALGRATTGSEYDLVDLNDLALQMADLYPTEAATLQAAVKKMVVANATNTTGCCGLSLYYPFYNKSYYQKSWQAEYSKLNLLPQYTTYLDNYAQRWLSSDLLENVASSQKPESVSGDTFILDLTQEQADSFSKAKYYILEKEGDDLYLPIYSSSDVTLDGSRLTANFDGNILYIKDEFYNYAIPATVEMDTTGNLTRYGISVTLHNAVSGSMTEGPDGGKVDFGYYRFQLAVNNDTKEISTSALLPYDQSVTTEDLMGGRLEDADLSKWTTYHFPNERHRYLSRYDNGVIKPISDWPVSGFISAYVFNVHNDMDFVFAPLVTGEYRLMFEVQDTQGSRYCSELLPITANGELDYGPAPEVTEKTWSSGDSFEIYNENGVAVTLTTAEDYNGLHYALRASNTNDFDAYVSIHKLFFNESVDCSDGWTSSLVVPAKGSCEAEILDFGDAYWMGQMKDVSSIQFNLEIANYKTKEVLAHDQVISVNLTPETLIPLAPNPNALQYIGFGRPAMGLYAEEQILFEENGIRGTLIGLGLGENEFSSSPSLGLKFENISDSYKVLRIDGLSFDGTFFPAFTNAEIPAGCTVYRDLHLNSDDIEFYCVANARNASLIVRFMDYWTLDGGGGHSETAWYPITLTPSGDAPQPLTEGSTVLYNENGVRLTLKSIDDHYEGTCYWYLVVTNNSGHDISFTYQDISVNDQVIDMESILPGVGLSDGKCGDGQKTICKVYCYTSTYGEELDVKITPVVYDITEETLLWTGSTPIELTYKP